MENLSLEKSLHSSNEETIRAASVLIELKKGKRKEVSAANCIEPVDKLQQNLVIDEHIYNENSAWALIFQDIKQELYFIEHLVKEMLKKIPDNYNSTLIETTFGQLKLSTPNGYILIQHAVTLVCNEFRRLLQYPLQEKFADRDQSLKHENLLLKIIYYVNKYEIHTWQEQTKYCNCYSPPSELIKFKALLKSTKTSLQTVQPTQHSKVLDAMKRNAVCIEKTGLLARHAYRHVVKVLKDDCNINILQENVSILNELQENDVVLSK